MQKKMLRIVTAIIITWLGTVVAEAGDNSTHPPYWDDLVAHPETFRFPEPVELVVAAEEWIPHIGVSNDPLTGAPIITGPMANLLDALAGSINFKYRIVRPSDGGWGIPRPGGSGDWTGMIGMVKRKEADIALGPFGLTYSRSRVVDFSSPILIDYYRILVRRLTPEPDPWGWRSPFTVEVWAGLAVSLFAVTVALWNTTRLFGIDSTIGKDQQQEQFGYLEHVWLIYAASLSQSVKWLSGSSSGRIILGIWLLTVVVASRSYSSALTSFLAVRTIATPYNYLTDLVEDKQVGMVFEAATALVEHLSTVDSGIYKQLANEASRSKFVTPPQLYEAAYNDIRYNRTALLVEDTTCRKIFSDDFTKYGRCDFYIGKERYWPLIFCMIGGKGNPILKAISSRIERLVAHDLYFKWLDNEVPNATACLGARNKVTVREPYKINGLWGVFVIFTAGLIISLICLLLELVYNKFKGPNNA